MPRAALIPRKIFWALVALSIVIIILGVVLCLSDQKASRVVIGGHQVEVEKVNSLAAERGLSNRRSLGENQGMLFVFDGYATPGFWMKEMNFPLDIIWIKDGTVTGLENNLPPEGERPQKIYRPLTLINYALEVNAGWADRNNIKIGDQVTIK